MLYGSVISKFDTHWQGGGPSIPMVFHLRRVYDLLYDWKSCSLCYMKDAVLHCSIFFKWNKIVAQGMHDHDDVIKWKNHPRYWPFVRGIHRSPVNSPHKGQWRGALMFSLICVWINAWVNNREAGDLRRYHAHDDVTVMIIALILNYGL